MPPLTRRRAARLRDERGIALVMALGMLLVVGIVGAALLEYSSANGRRTTISSSRTTAGALAEAGLNEAGAVLANPANDPTSPTLLATRTSGYTTGDVTWSGVLTGAYWTVTATSSVPSPTGASSLKRTVRSAFELRVDPTLPANLPWNYVYADQGCLSIGKGGDIYSPLYTRGGICIDKDAIVSSPTINARETMSVGWMATVGTASDRIPQVHVAGGCTYHGGPRGSPCGASHRVWADTSDTVVPDYSKPPIDLPKAFAESRPGPLNGCTTGSFPGGFDDNGVLDHSRGPVDLFPSSAYDCQTTLDGLVVGRIAWSPSTRVLTILGTVFFDGDIVLNRNEEYTYSGFGTIYTSGSVIWDMHTTLCATPGCDPASWNPNESMLVFVAGSTGVGFLLDKDARFQGAAYTVGDFVQLKNGLMQGPIVARTVTFEKHGNLAWPALWQMPSGTPSADRPRIAVVAGSWSG